MTNSSQLGSAPPSESWPQLRLADWKDTYTTLHMWTQIVGKIRLELTPKANHWWNVPLYVTSRGLSTSIMPYENRHFEMEFDFFKHELVIRTTDPQTASVALAPRTVADFYRELMSTLRSLNINVHIWKMPVEVASPTPSIKTQFMLLTMADKLNACGESCCQSMRYSRSFAPVSSGSPARCISFGEALIWR